MIHKIGAGLITDICDNVYEYRTNLFKEVSNMKESVLHMAYNYRKGSFSEAAMVLMDCVLSAILSPGDQGVGILKYLL